MRKLSGSSHGGSPRGGRMNSRRVAVIGAGAAGLCAAKHLVAAGLDVTLYEAGSGVGGLWVYKNDGGFSSAYKTLHINTDKYITQFEDFPLPATASVFPHHSEMRQYLEDYAAAFGLVRRTRFNTTVVQLSPRSGGDGGVRWQVCDSNGDEREFEAVVVANGHLSTPRHPDFAESFTGEYLHSHYYRDPADFAGKRICIVGAGNSACDIAADVCVTAQRTVMAVRSGVVIVPKLIAGVPLTQITTRLVALHAPPGLISRITKSLTYLIHGDMKRWGFRAPDAPTHPTSHATLISHLAYRRVEAKPGIRSVKDRRIEFADGTAEEFDTLIAATGYVVDIPFLSEEILALSDDWAPLYKRVVPVEWPGLYFVGLIQYVGPLFKAFDVQSAWIAEIESGRCLLPPPEHMRADIAAKHGHNRKAFHASPRHSLEEPAIPYQRDIRREIAEGRARARTADQADPAEQARMHDDRSISRRRPVLHDLMEGQTGR